MRATGHAVFTLSVSCTTFANVRDTTCKNDRTLRSPFHVLPIVVHAMGDLPIECLPIERLATDFASMTRKKKMMRSFLRSILPNVH